MSFLGTTVAAPGGPALLAERTGAALVPYTFLETTPGRYGFTFHGPLTVAAPEERAAALQQVFDVVADTLLTGRAGGWEMWWQFDDMLVDDHTPLDREPVLTADE